MARPKVLLIGTGYVAGSVLALLLKEDKYEISATSRKPEHLAKLKEAGVKGIKASLDDADLIESAVYANDIVINGASSDHPVSVDATLRGIEKRSADGRRSIYIHSSGTGVLDDQAGGNHDDFVEFSDEAPDQIEGLDDGQPHRLIDKKIARYAEKLQDKASLRIILPPLIYGKGSGLFNQLSIQTPAIIRASLERKEAGVFGRGRATWSHVHVLDLAKGYVTLLHALEEGKLPQQSPYDVYVFCESGDHRWIDLSTELGKRLHERGVLPSAKVTSFSESELAAFSLKLPAKKLGSARPYETVGCNSRSKAVKLRQLGWQPEQPAFFDTLDYDLDTVLAESK